jgi:hypothetical protein
MSTFSGCSMRFGFLLAAIALTAQAQEHVAPAPSLPPAPTPTALYPASGLYSSGMSGGTSLVAWQSLYLPIHARLPAQINIRNTDPDIALVVTHAHIYDANGKQIRDLLPAPLSVPPFGVRELAVQRSDGGSVIIEWSAERPINPPQVEALHGDARSTMFVSIAQPIRAR